jgi:hypothetical protein
MLRPAKDSPVMCPLLHMTAYAPEEHEQGPRRFLQSLHCAAGRRSRRKIEPDVEYASPGGK